MNFTAAFVLTLAAAGDAGPVVVPPKIHMSATQLESCMSRSAVPSGYQGFLDMEFLVEPDGSARVVPFTAGTEPWQELTADCVLARARFTAGTVDGRPVTAKVMLPIRVGRGGAAMERPELRSKSAEVENAYRACYPQDALATQTAQYNLTIGTDGRASDIKLLVSGGDAQLDEAGICVIQKLQFKPTQRNGKAIKSTITLPLQMRPAR